MLVLYLLYHGLRTRLSHYFYIMAFFVGSVVFFFSADYVLNNVMEQHQRVRINVLLGLDEDLAEPDTMCIRVKSPSVRADLKARVSSMERRLS